MKLRSIRIVEASAALLCLCGILFLGSCAEAPGSNERSPYEESVWKDEYDGIGADMSKLSAVEINVNTEGAMKITLAELASLVRSGEIEQDGKYEVTDESGLVFGSDDPKKEYDFKNATISFPKVNGAALDLSGAYNLTLSNVNVISDGEVGIFANDFTNLTLDSVSVQGVFKKGADLQSGSGLTLSGCSILSSGKAKADYGLCLGCEDAVVINTHIFFCTCGIYDAAAFGSVIENNLIQNCDTGIQTVTSGSTVWYNTISNAAAGILASYDKAELSAVYAKGHNIIAAVNKIVDTDVGISFANVSNGVVLLNSSANISVEGGINNYVIENTVSEKLFLKSNNYLIADGNIVKNLEASGNDNINGDNITDVNARAACGVNEELLPHINNELFVGMERADKVKSAGKNHELLKYIKDGLGSKKFVIVPPGAYLNRSMYFSDLSDVTVYAYGVLNETATAAESGLVLTECTDFTLKGMTFSTAVSPTIQGTVTAISKNGDSTKISFVADDGYPKDFSSSSFGATAQGNLYKPGSLVPYSEVFYSTKAYNTRTNTNVIFDSNAQGNVEVGDRIAFRNGLGNNATAFVESSGCLMKDVTVFASSGFCEYDMDCDIAPTLYRYAIVAGPAPVLDPKTECADVGKVNWTDSYGRLRSGKPILTTCDATHSSNNRVGIQIISSRFEQMFDDGGNINARYGLAVSFKPGARILTYSEDATVYKLICHIIKKGDEVLIFDMSGKIVGRSTATSDSVSIGDGRYTVTLADNIDGVKSGMIVQNITWSSNGFLVDNVLVKNNNSNGFRIKASNGKVTNCTFENLAKYGIAALPEYQNWPEVGFAENVEITNNVFRHIGEIHQIWEGGKPCIETIVFKNADVISSDPDYCLHKNILIEGNRFEDCMTSYDIGITCAQNVTIRNNVFGTHNVTSGKHGAVNIYGGLDITVSDNTFAPGGEKVTARKNVKNLKGTDIGQKTK